MSLYTEDVNRNVLRYAISDRGWYASSEQERHAALRKQAARLAADGVDFFQLREKDLCPADLAALSRVLLLTLRGSATKLLINSRADVAIATAAHGVHLTSHPDDLTARQVHDLYAQANLPAPLVTLSCHSLEDIARHRLEPLSVILFGPVFEKSVSGKRQSDGIGLDLLGKASLAAAPIPVLALGGVTHKTISACLEAGASGIAGIRIFQCL